MSVSLERARQCIGRLITHDEPIKLTGVVDHVTDLDVWVKTSDGDVVPCIPENMSWVSRLSDSLRDAIETWDDYEDAQIGYTHCPTTGDGEDLRGIGIVYSSAIANDDGQNHPLYVIAHTTHRVTVVWWTALHDTAREIEELLGWAQP